MNQTQLRTAFNISYPEKNSYSRTGTLRRPLMGSFSRSYGQIYESSFCYSGESINSGYISFVYSHSGHKTKNFYYSISRGRIYPKVT